MNINEKANTPYLITKHLIKGIVLPKLFKYIANNVPICKGIGNIVENKVPQKVVVLVFSILVVLHMFLTGT